MTSPLREALDDLVADVPAHIVTDDIGTRAWASGRRRRVRRWAANTALAFAFLGVLTVAVVPLVRDPRTHPADSSGAAVDGYSQRIGHQWWTPDLPDRPGPVAAVVNVVDHHSTADEFAGWHAVAGDGRRWRIPVANDMAEEVHPTVSPDGRAIGYLAGNAGPYVIHHLGTGRRTEFPQVGSGITTVRTPYWAAMQAPSFWSPDRNRVLLTAGRRDPSDSGTGLVLDLDGSLRPTTLRGWAVGWIDDTALAWLDWPPDKKLSETPGATPQVHMTSLDGTVRRSIPLRPSQPWQTDGFSQWTGAVSPDGTQLLVRDAALLRRFSLADGRETPGPVPVDGISAPCGAAWAGAVPTVPVDDDTGARSAAVRGHELDPLVVTEPSLGVHCVTWASDALAGGPHWTPFGRSTWWWTWWWREIAIGLLLTGACAWAVRRWRGRIPPLGRRQRHDQPEVDWWA